VCGRGRVLKKKGIFNYKKKILNLSLAKMDKKKKKKKKKKQDFMKQLRRAPRLKRETIWKLV